ncbi:PUA-like domain-containing protein [Coniochaeta sp. 2T2.1]|nr:PUA-like domain-containing protein [Coniochaeta sp. 2T2.1]
MAKRKSTSDAVEEPLRRSTRQRTSTNVTPAQSQPPKTEPLDEQSEPEASAKLAPKKTPLKKEAKPVKEAPKAAKNNAKPVKVKEDVESKDGVKEEDDTTDGLRQYWLMKAEPETRLEGGVDVRFSIDDLAAKTEPEPWDGIRAYAARNNLRAMKKGDLAFFYHSNCKEPGIVGTMEIVEEHSPDLTAHDPKAPYYDPKDKPSDPKWSVVHVVFRSKFDVQIGLKELRTLCAPGKPLENMQMLKQSRLSVSKVSAGEWKFINELAERKAKEAGS